MKTEPLSLPKVDLKQIAYAPALKLLVDEIKPKQITLYTYNISYDTIEYLNTLAFAGAAVHVVAAQIEVSRDGEKQPPVKFSLEIDRKNHSKIWVLDNRVFVGSTNLSADTIFNIMVELDEPQTKELARILFWRKGRYAQKSYTIKSTAKSASSGTGNQGTTGKTAKAKK